eukprot:TRINITY_DN1150_c0_g1_i1.p1 TRINITY_DN1150_c0_g1~~TRINITY_DN1150_c0_g1_i1.p1  ORF type:complete len:315 (-),score=69.18 TRINITY_DN1150_c0_g1_i1:159-1103(-)
MASMNLLPRSLLLESQGSALKGLLAEVERSTPAARPSSGVREPVYINLSDLATVRNFMAPMMAAPQPPAFYAPVECAGINPLTGYSRETFTKPVVPSLASLPTVASLAPYPQDLEDDRSTRSADSLEKADSSDAASTGPSPTGNDALVDSQPSAEWGETVTIMLRNLSDKYTRASLMTEIDNAGFAGLYDFFYLPIDPKKNTNPGYAFLSFIDPVSSWKFKNTFQGRQMHFANAGKRGAVVAAAVQGYDANYALYAGARVSRGPHEARPLFLKNGVKQADMIPTSQAAHQAPKPRRHKGGAAGQSRKGATAAAS